MSILFFNGSQFPSPPDLIDGRIDRQLKYLGGYDAAAEMNHSAASRETSESNGDVVGFTRMWGSRLGRFMEFPFPIEHFLKMRTAIYFSPLYLHNCFIVH